MRELEVGQVLSLKIRYNNNGDSSSTKHPYLIINVDDSLGVIEVAQIDSLAGKEYKAAFKSNKVILNSNPIETVIDKDSFIQMDNIILIEKCEELKGYRRQIDKLSAQKLQSVITAYKKYHETHEIDENKTVYMDKSEIVSLN